MIKANELRIGNCVIFKGEITHVTAVLVFDREDYDPIPLTPEILEKCGFKPFRGIHNFICGDIAIRQEEADYFLIAQEVMDEYLIFIGKPFQYVHQLQNLFFDLTGEELKCEL